MRQAFRAIVIVLLLTVASASFAATRYVTDEFRINLRSGPGNGYRITELLTTGTPLELLDSRDGWTQVRAPGGQTGWVPSQYLSSERPAAERLDEVAAELETVRQRNQALSEELAQTEQALQQANGRIDSLSGSREELSQKLDAARQGLELSEENKRLKKQVIDLERRIQDLVNETERLSDRSRQDWFLVGAGVLFAGMIVGIIITRIRWRRRSSWGDL